MEIQQRSLACPWTGLPGASLGQWYAKRKGGIAGAFGVGSSVRSFQGTVGVGGSTGTTRRIGKGGSLGHPRLPLTRRGQPDQDGVPRGCRVNVDGRDTREISKLYGALEGAIGELLVSTNTIGCLCNVRRRHDDDSYS